MPSDPEICPFCNQQGRVINSRNEARGYRYRRRRCPNDHRWPTWETTMPPHEQITRARALAKPQPAGKQN